MLKINGSSDASKILAGEMADEDRSRYVATATILYLVAKRLADDLRNGNDESAVAGVVFFAEIGQDFCQELTQHFKGALDKVIKARKENDNESDSDHDATA